MLLQEALMACCCLHTTAVTILRTLHLHMHATCMGGRVVITQSAHLCSRPVMWKAGIRMFSCGFWVWGWVTRMFDHAVFSLLFLLVLCCGRCICLTKLVAHWRTACCTILHSCIGHIFAVGYLSYVCLFAWFVSLFFVLLVMCGS